MTYEPEGGWAQTPPAPLLEALSTIEALQDGYERSSNSKLLLPGTAMGAARAYREAARILRTALQEVYAP